MSSDAPFNPLDKRNLGESVAEALLHQGVHPLAPTSSFIGAGIYAIYYSGNFPNYKSISKLNKEESTTPIYVGKAVPKGARKGGFGLGISPGKVLYDRLREHQESIEQAENLNVKDFKCRYLIVDDIWVPLGESLLIQKFMPLWNRVVEGFGNHDPGSKRHTGARPIWDMIHPGRPWAAKCAANPRPVKDIIALINKHFDKEK